MKSIYKILCCVFAASFFLFSCVKEISEPGFLEIEQESLTLLEQPFVHTASSRMVPLNTNLDVVKVSSSADWCKVSIVEDNGRLLRIDMYPNEGFEDRKAEITIYGVGVQSIIIPVEQWSSEVSLVVAEAEGIDVVDGELDFTLHITSNVDFTLELPDWISDVGDNSSYIGSKLYTFIASPIAPGSREGEIKIVTDGYPDLDQQIIVSQLQNILYPILGNFTPSSGEKESAVTLHGANFGTNKELVKVFFNAMEAEVVAVEDDAITVIVPRAPGNPATIKVNILEEEMAYPTTFDYVSSWGLYTVTGDGESAFRGGTLTQGRLKARYISLDKNGNIFASHRDQGSERHVIRINEAENIVESVSNNNSLIPNGLTVGSNNEVYVANDGGSGTSYYELDPTNNWTPIERIITYPNGNPPNTGSAGIPYMYRLVYNPKDNHLYGLLGHNAGVIIKINPSTQIGEVIYQHEAHPYWYGLIIDPTGRYLYMAVNSAAVNYGPYRMDLENIPANGSLTRLNTAGPTAAATLAQLNDGPLVNAAFGQSWDYEFGPDGHLYVSDFNHHVIRRINLSTQMVETVVGQAGAAGNVDGSKDQARLNGPRGLAWNEDGTTLYIFDFTGNRLRKWTLD